MSLHRDLKYIFDRGGYVKPLDPEDYDRLDDELPAARWADIVCPTDSKAQENIIAILEEMVEGIRLSVDSESAVFFFWLPGYRRQKARMHCMTHVIHRDDVEKCLCKQDVIPSSESRIPEWQRPENK